MSQPHGKSGQVLRSTAVAPLACKSIRRSICRVLRDRRGVAGIEFALIGATICFLTLNVVDGARYIYTLMAVQDAAQNGAQAASKACDATKVPATTMCPGLVTAMTAAVQSTSLGTHVALASGSPSEGYYCVNASNALQYVSAVSTKPANCSAAGMPALQPADYLVVDVTYPYAALFGDLTVARLFPTPITANARVRLQ